MADKDTKVANTPPWTRRPIVVSGIKIGYTVRSNGAALAMAGRVEAAKVLGKGARG